MVPFLNYTKHLGYLHKICGSDVGDCIHFCSTPFLWAPLWSYIAQAAIDLQPPLEFWSKREERSPWI